MSKIALVTGGTSGIGKETALYLAKNGCTVYELSRREEGVEGLRHIRADVTDEESVRELRAQVVSAFGGLDVVVANAGIFSSAPLHELTEEQWNEMIDVNLSGVWKTMRAAVPTLIEQEQADDGPEDQA